MLGVLVVQDSLAERRQHRPLAKRPIHQMLTWTNGNDNLPKTLPAENGYFLLLDFISAFFRFSATLNLTILLINLSGNGLSMGNCIEPLAVL